MIVSPEFLKQCKPFQGSKRVLRKERPKSWNAWKVNSGGVGIKFFFFQNISGRYDYDSSMCGTKSSLRRVLSTPPQWIPTNTAADGSTIYCTGAATFMNDGLAECRRMIENKSVGLVIGMGTWQLKDARIFEYEQATSALTERYQSN